ncbi:glycosyl transferase [Candidatus Gracilibacteria bacterium]|nr:MAG: glycosyl transferase [Candidatus Gracilibacteria bacterium]PIE85601.1 MAG: glycosyl transferase [Candidatus Gracilibacteria bacterium]
MKLIIQIPCYNEEKTLGLVLSELPKKLDGIDIIETMIIDDGSSDKTLEIAKKYKVNYVVKHIGNKGLGNSFKTGVEKALLEGADILVNTDGDNQYPSKYIKDLIKPIVDKESDFVIGDRQTSKISHFSLIKKILQYVGSFMVRFLSGTKVPDSVSGFRAYSRECLLKLNVTSDFSYAVDTLVQAGSKRIKITAIKIQTNSPTRPSRLFKNIWQHIYKTTSILFRTYSMYNPIRLFFVFGSIFFTFGVIIIGRFLYYYYLNPVDTGKIQSLILAAIFVIISVQFFALGIVGDLIAKNRKLIEDNLYYSKKQYFDKNKAL